MADILNSGLCKGKFFLLFFFPITFFPSSFPLTSGAAVVASGSLSNSLFCFKKLYRVIAGSQSHCLFQVRSFQCICLFFFFNFLLISPST